MATTAMTLRANRELNVAVLVGTVTSVPLDANVSENFTLPAGFGDLWLEQIIVQLYTFSGAYAAPAPAYDGIQAMIINTASVPQDFIGSTRWVHAGTDSARPVLSASIEQLYKQVVRQNEMFNINVPISGGGGVTASMTLLARGPRLRPA